jgi:putative PIN family toxin of toxin-antitoxin system
MKVVLDSNVLLAALGARGLCEAVLAVCLESHEIVLSEHILGEVHRHLTTKFKVPARQARESIAFLREHCLLVKPGKVPARACRDADDLPVLGTILAAGADCLISGDQDLLTLREYRGVPIFAPRAFHDRLKSRRRRR